MTKRRLHSLPEDTPLEKRTVQLILLSMLAQNPQVQASKSKASVGKIRLAAEMECIQLPAASKAHGQRHQQNGVITSSKICSALIGSYRKAPPVHSSGNRRMVRVPAPCPMRMTRQESMHRLCLQLTLH